MTKQDYIAIADCARRSRIDSKNVEVLDTFLQHLCFILATDNPAFNKAQFLAACK